MVQLRDPLRNYEPVGAPMLALIQVERVFVPPKPKIYCKVSELRNNNEEDDDESESVVKQEVEKQTREKALEEEGIPQFQITEVHVAGMKSRAWQEETMGYHISATIRFSLAAC
ncbi:PROTEIN PLASTID MOVEMENT IMPAIRED 1-RELATED 1 [Salix koriyanagi]|uniref:PROTEIN PLASTID MOVEMENT IMPAIRED 1-RELATED 1 n=1 Tax=Salix koriyanagi TaxID=2511006 RepID=A0A9Q0VD33_9ROSI|nr:PROTEIN PLASTID MOVEMENT IMPAIRED 1-RELATED 1 [Salix koriyanagi]